MDKKYEPEDLKEHIWKNLNPKCKQCSFLEYNDVEDTFWCRYDDINGENHLSYQIILLKKDCRHFERR